MAKWFIEHDLIKKEKYSFKLIVQSNLSLINHN